MHLVGSMAYKNKKNAQTAMFYMFFRHWFQILWRQRGWIQEMSQGLAQGVGVSVCQGGRERIVTKTSMSVPQIHSSVAPTAYAKTLRVPTCAAVKMVSS